MNNETNIPGTLIHQSKDSLHLTIWKDESGAFDVWNQRRLIHEDVTLSEACDVIANYEARKYNKNDWYSHTDETDRRVLSAALYEKLSHHVENLPNSPAMLDRSKKVSRDIVSQAFYQQRSSNFGDVTLNDMRNAAKLIGFSQTDADKAFDFGLKQLRAS